MEMAYQKDQNVNDINQFVSFDDHKKYDFAQYAPK
jgi:hypothetical protein